MGYYDGEADGKDDNENPIKVPQFITVKKGEAQQLVSIPLEHYLKRADGIDNRSTTKMLASTLGNFSPVTVGSFDSQNMWLSAVSQFGPALSATVGLGTNVNPGTGQKIIPESRLEASPYLQYGATTPENLKEIGKAINVSPSQIDFVLNSFGGVPGQVVKGANIIEQKAKGTEKQKSLSGTTFGELTKYPFLSTFIREAGESGSPEMQNKMKEKSEMNTNLIDRKLINKDQAQIIYDHVNKLTDKNAKKQFLEKQFMSPEVKGQVVALAALKRTRGVLSTKDSSELRANYIFKELTDMKARGDDREAMVSYLDDLTKVKIITTDVKSQLAGLNAYVANIDALKGMDDDRQKAQYIMDSLKGLKEKKVSGSLMGQYLDRLSNERIITPEVKDMMVEIKKTGK